MYVVNCYLCWAQSCSCILPLYACASAVCSSSSSDVQTPSLQPLAYLRSMIPSTLTDACICKLQLYILAGCGKQQTRNDRLFIAMRIVCHCLLKTFDANFPVWHRPLSEVYLKNVLSKENFPVCHDLYNQPIVIIWTVIRHTLYRSKMKASLDITYNSHIKLNVCNVT